MKTEVKKYAMIVDNMALCDICGGRLKAGVNFYDARTRQGSWGWLCWRCFARHGIGLGADKGQQYSSYDDSKMAG